MQVPASACTVRFMGVTATDSRALEANLAAAAGQLGSRALAGDGAGVLAGPAAGLGGWNGVQAVRERIQVGLGRLQRALGDPTILEQLRSCKACRMALSKAVASNCISTCQVATTLRWTPVSCTTAAGCSAN